MNQRTFTSRCHKPGLNPLHACAFAFSGSLSSGAEGDAAFVGVSGLVLGFVLTGSAAGLIILYPSILLDHPLPKFAALLLRAAEVIVAANLQPRYQRFEWV